MFTTTSEARILANRENAKHSTGPRTEAGKIQSRRNALRHGLASTGIALLPEDEAKFAERRQSWGEVLRPADDVEAFLVERAVVHSVKLERASAVEATSARGSVERADQEYEADVLKRLEAAEAEVRAWERLGEGLAKFGTLGRDGLDSAFRLLEIGGFEDCRRHDLFDLAEAAGSSAAQNEAARVAAREALADLIGARLEERRRAVTRIFEEIDGPEGRALARAKAALDTGPAGLLARRYEEAEERGLMRMLDGLDRRRKAAATSTQTPDSTDSRRQSEGVGGLGKLPNEPNEPRAEERSGDPENLGKLPNEPNDLATETRSGGSEILGKLPNEPNGVESAGQASGSGKLGKRPNELNVGVAEGSGTDHPARSAEAHPHRIGEQVGGARGVRPTGDDARRVA